MDWRGGHYGLSDECVKQFGGHGLRDGWFRRLVIFVRPVVPEGDGLIWSDFDGVFEHEAAGQGWLLGEEG